MKRQPEATPRTSTSPTTSERRFHISDLPVPTGGVVDSLRSLVPRSGAPCRGHPSDDRGACRTNPERGGSRDRSCLLVDASADPPSGYVTMTWRGQARDTEARITSTDASSRYSSWSRTYACTAGDTRSPSARPARTSSRIAWTRRPPAARRVAPREHVAALELRRCVEVPAGPRRHEQRGRVQDPLPVLPVREVLVHVRADQDEEARALRDSCGGSRRACRSCRRARRVVPRARAPRCAAAAPRRAGPWPPGGGRASARGPSRLCGACPAGTTSSRSTTRSAASASTRCPWWNGSKLPPITQTRGPGGGAGSDRGRAVKTWAARKNAPARNSQMRSRAAIPAAASTPSTAKRPAPPSRPARTGWASPESGHHERQSRAGPTRRAVAMVRRRARHRRHEQEGDAQPERHEAALPAASGGSAGRRWPHEAEEECGDARPGRALGEVQDEQADAGETQDGRHPEIALLAHVLPLPGRARALRPAAASTGRYHDVPPFAFAAGAVPAYARRPCPRAPFPA